MHVLLILQSDHKKLVALLKPDDAVAKEPHAAQEWIAADEPVNGCADDCAGLKNLRPHHDAGRTTERTEERRTDVAHDLALELDALAFGFRQLSCCDQLFARAQIVVKLCARFSECPDGQRGVREPVRVRAREPGVEPGKYWALACAGRERERDHDRVLRISPRPIVSFEETRSRRGRQTRHTRARADNFRGPLVMLLRFAKDLARFFTGGAAGIA